MSASDRVADTAPTQRGEVTRQRILEVAAAEFARHGIAGARVERIVREARTNKAQLYGYFGSKEKLFDVVFAASLDLLLAEVPIDGFDLAGWAVRLYDECLERPDLVRIATWYRLERQPIGPLVADSHRLSDVNLAAIAQAQERGHLPDASAYDLMTMVIAMSMAWSPVSNVYAASRDEPARVHASRRAYLHRAVQAITKV